MTFGSHEDRHYAQFSTTYVQTTLFELYLDVCQYCFHCNMIYFHFLPLLYLSTVSPSSYLILLLGSLEQGFRFFFNIGGPKWPMEQKMVGHFLKWWAQAYQTYHSWHLDSILYLHTDTDTCMQNIGVLTADYTVKPVLSGHSKRRPLSLNEGQKYCRMLQEEHSAIILTFIKLPFVIKIFILSFLNGCLRHALLYWQPTSTFCFVEFIDSL